MLTQKEFIVEIGGENVLHTYIHGFEKYEIAETYAKQHIEEYGGFANIITEERYKQIKSYECCKIKKVKKVPDEILITTDNRLKNYENDKQPKNIIKTKKKKNINQLRITTR